MRELNRLILIGNGFDLAHGLKTSYKNFLDWYMCDAFQMFCDNKSYNDPLIEVKNKYPQMMNTFNKKPTTFEEILNLILFDDFQSITYKSNFFRTLLDHFKDNNWVDIELYYFRLLKDHFSKQEKKEVVCKLNSEFDFLIRKLSDYIKTINDTLTNVPKLKVDNLNTLNKAFAATDSSEVKFLNFNYTETVYAKDYAYEDEIIHIHGRVADINRNPIVFGYGDESDPSLSKN